jgi:hypothetical protein
VVDKPDGCSEAEQIYHPQRTISGYRATRVERPEIRDAVLVDPSLADLRAEDLQLWMVR